MLPPAPALSPVTIPAPLIVDTAVALEADFVARFPAGFTFPPILDNQNDRAFISRYQANIDEVIDSVKAVCGSALTRSASTGTAPTGNPLTGTALTGTASTGSVLTGSALTGSALTGGALTGIALTGSAITGSANR